MAQKWEAIGGRGGNQWGDGSDVKEYKKVYVGEGDSGVTYLKFDYEKDGEKLSAEHGKMTILPPEEFEIDPEDYITYVKVYYEKLWSIHSEIITGLVFKTFKGKTSLPFGLTSGVEAEIGGGKIVGFHGTASDVIHSLGAYILPSSTPLTLSSNTVPAQGGDGGGFWDDRVHDGVKKIYVGLIGDSCVSYFKADYEKASKLVPGSDHGRKMSSHKVEEFVLDKDEYITAVSGYYDKFVGAKVDKVNSADDNKIDDKIDSADALVIISLKFKTNKKTSILYGPEVGTEFVLEKKDHKIVGFHGKAGNYLYKLGVNVAPIAN